jgi:hypothetical protein
MYFVIRWSENNEDLAAVIEAETRAGAEYSALKRNIPVVIVTEADPDDIRDARAAKRLWKYSPDRGHRAFGMTLSAFHLTCVMIVGVLTAALHTGRALAGEVPSLAPQFLETTNAVRHDQQ